MASTIGYSVVHLPPPAANPTPGAKTQPQAFYVITVGGAPGGPYEVLIALQPPAPPNAGGFVPPPGQYIISEGVQDITFTVSTRVLGVLNVPPSSTARRIGVTMAGNELIAGWAEAGSNALTFSLANAGDLGASNGLSWTTPATIPQTSFQGVDMAPTSPGQGQAYIAWTGTDAAGTINTGMAIAINESPFIPTYVSSTVLTEQGQTSESACAVAGSKLASSSYVAWTGTNTTHSPNILGPITKGETAQQYILGADTAVGPPRLFFEDAAPLGSPEHNAQYFDSHLYMTWVSQTAGPAMNLLDVALGGVTGTKYVLPVISLCAPALLNFGGPGVGPWFMAWIDGATGHLALAASPGGNPNNWQRMTLYPPKPLNVAGVSLAPLPASNQLLVAWVEGAAPGFVNMATVSSNFMDW